MNELILRIIEQGGYLGIAFLMIVENVFPPIPSEVIMGFGGVAMARGTMEFWPLLLAGSIGSTIGNYVWFLLGDKWGYRRLQPVIERWGRWLTVEFEDIEKASRFFQSHGQWVVFGLRFSPFFRTIVSLPAGLAHMRHWKFLVFTFAGTTVWNVILILGGSWLAPMLDRYSRLTDIVIVGGLVIGLGWYAYRVATWKRD